MRERHSENAREIRALVYPGGTGPFEGVLVGARNTLRDKSPLATAQILEPVMAEWDRFDSRYNRALQSLVLLEAWSLLAILGALTGFACVPWLASKWNVFASLLIVSSVVTVAVTGAALYVIAQRD